MKQVKLIIANTETDTVYFNYGDDYSDITRVFVEDHSPWEEVDDDGAYELEDDIKKSREEERKRKEEAERKKQEKEMKKLAKTKEQKILLLEQLKKELGE